jgi:hypothetical protein
MKTDLELLEILKEELLINTHSLGLCGMVAWLSPQFNGVLTKKEESRLMILILSMKPKTTYKEDNAYYWQHGAKTPRLRAINKLINKLEEEQL